MPQETPTHTDAADGRGAVTQTPIHTWTAADGRELMTHVHLPAGGRADVVVVLADGLGRDEVVAYRSYRMLAERIAASGGVAVRFAWSGTADSSEPDDDRPCTERWLDDLDAVVRAARATAPGAPVALVGLRASAPLVTVHADTAAERPDQLVLWEPVGSGRPWLRSQSTLHKVSGEFRARTLFPPLPEGSVEIPGRLVEARDAAALRALTARVPDGVRIDVVQRPNALQDKHLVPVLAAAASVTEIDGQAETFDMPTLLSRVSVETLDTITGLLVRGTAVDVVPPQARTRAVVARRDRRGERVEVVERIIRIGDLHAVVTNSVGDPTAALLTVPGSAEPMDGPTGLWARLARDGAARGVTSLRLDRHGVGEGGDPQDVTDPWPYRKSSVDDYAAGFAALRAETGIAPTIVGMCSGSWIATQVALREQVPQVIAVNQVAWDLEALPEGNPLPAVIDIADVPGTMPATGEDPGATPPAVPASVRLRLALKNKIPAPAWTVLARRGKVQMAAPLFDAVTARGTAIHQIVSDADLRYIDGQQMRYVLRLLTARGRDITITRRRELDHALLSYASRERAINDILSVVNRSRSGVAPRP